MFLTNETLDIQFGKWQRQFKKSLYANFRKVRISENKIRDPSKLDILMDKKKTILKKKNLLPQDMKEVEEIDCSISRECEDRELKKLKDVVGSLETKEGNTNIWRQMRRAFPKKNKPLPTGVKNIEAKVITNPEEKKHVILKHFAHRMRKRPVKDDVKDIIDLNEKLFKQRLINVKSVKSSPFSMAELTITLKNLTLGKSRDPDNIVCDIFKDGVIGDNLKESILLMMNKIKEEMKVP